MLDGIFDQGRDFQLGELTNIIRSPLNGTAVDERSTTRLMTVKIDNHPKARPQSGIQHADMMIEIDATRAAVMFAAMSAGDPDELRITAPLVKA